MWKGRFIVWCALALFAGILVGGTVVLPPWVALSAAMVSAIISLRLHHPATFLVSFFLLGASSTILNQAGGESTGTILGTKADAAKASFSEYLSSLAEEGDERSILKALAIGDKSEISRELNSAYREAGASHLLALSGLHVGIIYGIISLALSFLGGALPMRITKSGLTIASLWTYAIISGLSPSIARAVTMITLYEISSFTGSSKDGLSSLAVSAIIILTLNPAAARQISFQLSYSAVLSIYTVYPRLKRLFSTKMRIMTYVWNSISLAISCQLTCGILGWMYFGTFPKYFMLTNLLALPVATVVMYCVSAAVLTSAVPWLGPMTAKIAVTAIHLLNDAVRTIASLP